MSCFYKVHFIQHFKDGSVEKSLLGEILAPTVKSFSDVVNLLESNLNVVPLSGNDIDFLELSVSFKRVDPDFTDYKKDF